MLFILNLEMFLPSQTYFMNFNEGCINGKILKCDIKNKKMNNT